MKTVVLGGGIVGVTTAWTLAKAGIDVVVVERQSAVAEETSRGNACLITPGHSMVWNQPGAPLEHLRSLFQRDPVSAAKLFANPGFLPWIVRFLVSCRGSVSKRNTLLNLLLAKRSADLTRDIIDQQQLDIAMKSAGSLYWCDSEKKLEEERRHCEFLNSQGIAARILGAQELLEEEPAFVHSRRPLQGALHVLDDFSADCRQFSVQLLEQMVGEGKVQLLADTKINTIKTDGRSVIAIETSSETLEADHYVLALGPESGAMARSLGLTLPIAPARGYSLTVPVKLPERLPQHGGVDLTDHVAFAPLNDQLRITCYAKFEGFDRSWSAGNFLRHRRTTEALFPDLIDWDGEQNEWAGLRPMTPDGLPVIGCANPYDNLWLNTGHGYLGWTQAAASAQILLQKMTTAETDDFTDAFELRW